VKSETVAVDYLNSLMRRYQTGSLVNVTPQAFKQQIDSFLQISDYKMEGYQDPNYQRDLSIKFHWGHDHDFGDFALKGRMEKRHIWLLSTFMDSFKALPKTLAGCRVLDIGCWTGGASLLLSAMGAKVLAIDEVKKYVEALRYLKHAFDLKDLEVQNMSLYECTRPDFQDAFDYILFAGVLYHVTDPILALRITFNCLKDGGKCLVETAAIDSKQTHLSYEGPTIVFTGTKEQMNRGGWNWFMPSPSTLSQMMKDVGYGDVSTSDCINGRAFAVGTRHKHVDMTRAGISVRDIR
jgi:SAM-dependent methyltransferase